ncbi:MAG: type II secretion system protein GspL [Caulobacter sp.]|nr:type II secretion system protein GspL [Caulobacter sp.]
MTLNRLVIFFADPERPPEVLETVDGEILRYDVMDDHEAATWAPARTLLIVPGADVAARWLDLPAASDAQARSAAGFMLEDALAGPASEHHIAVGPPGDGRRLVVVVDHARLRSWMDRAAALGVSPDIVTPDHLSLPESLDGQPLGVRFGGLLAVRGHELALSGEPELLGAVLGDRSPAAANPLEAAALLARGALTPAVNLLQGDFARGGGRTPGGAWKRAAILASLLIVSPLVIGLAQLARNTASAAALERQADKRAVAMAPAARNQKAPARFVLGQIEQRRAANRFLDTASAFFQVVQASGAVRMDTLVYGADGALRTTVSYLNYSDLDGLKTAAREAGLDLTDDATVTEGGKISSDLIIRKAP